MNTPPPNAPKGSDPAQTGLTLIELVAAMAVFALIAMMGLQALTGSLRMRDALASRAAATEDLGRALALLRHDIAATVPITFYPPGQARPASALRGDARGMQISRGGLPDPTGAPRIGRVEWVLNGDTLQRHVWPTTIPASPAQRSPAVTAITGVTGLSTRSYWPPGRWSDGLRPPGGGNTTRLRGPESNDDDSEGAASEVYSSNLPIALEVTLITRDFGPVVLIESLK